MCSYVYLMKTLKNLLTLTCPSKIQESIHYLKETAQPKNVSAPLELEIGASSAIKLKRVSALLIIYIGLFSLV